MGSGGGGTRCGAASAPRMAAALALRGSRTIVRREAAAAARTVRRYMLMCESIKEAVLVGGVRYKKEAARKSTLVESLMEAERGRGNYMNDDLLCQHQLCQPDAIFGINRSHLHAPRTSETHASFAVFAAT
jgi:hypothetical protein